MNTEANKKHKDSTEKMAFYYKKAYMNEALGKLTGLMEIYHDYLISAQHPKDFLETPIIRETLNLVRTPLLNIKYIEFQDDDVCVNLALVKVYLQHADSFTYETMSAAIELTSFSAFYVRVTGEVSRESKTFYEESKTWYENALKIIEKTIMTNEIVNELNEIESKVNTIVNELRVISVIKRKLHSLLSSINKNTNAQDLKPRVEDLLKISTALDEKIRKNLIEKCRAHDTGLKHQSKNDNYQISKSANEELFRNINKN